MALDFPPNATEPDPLIDGQQWTDTGSTPNVVWTYSITSGWSRLASTLGSDPNLQIEPTVGSLTVGLSTGDTTGMTGINNTLVGKQNGTVIATGAGNTTLGSGAGTTLADGNDNTLIGKNAGASLSGANTDDNVFIGSGAQAGYSQALDCVVIGKDASTLTTDENDAIVIGAGSVGKGSGTAVIGNESTCTDVYLNGTLHITGVSPGDWLKVDADGESVIASPVAIANVQESFIVNVGDFSGQSMRYFVFPYDFTITEIKSYTRFAVSGADLLPTIELNAASIFSTEMTIEIGDTSSKTATTQPILLTTVFLSEDRLDLYYNEGAASLNSLSITIIGYQT